MHACVHSHTVCVRVRLAAYELTESLTSPRCRFPPPLHQAADAAALPAAGGGGAVGHPDASHRSDRPLCVCVFCIHVCGCVRSVPVVSERRETVARVRFVCTCMHALAESAITPIPAADPPPQQNLHKPHKPHHTHTLNKHTQSPAQNKHRQQLDDSQTSFAAGCGCAAFRWRKGWAG
jgi:hypothetical protein